MTQYLPLLIFAVLLAGGQVLFKKAALASLGQPLFPGLANIWMLCALVVYAVATLLWVDLLRRLPLSVAYPFAALGFVLVPLAARFVFGEQLDGRYALGAAFIVAGILLTSR